MGKYLKALVAVAGAAVTAGLGLGLTGTIQQVLTVAAAVLTATGVYAVPNAKTPPEVFLKMSDSGKSLPIPMTTEKKPTVS